MNQFLKSQNLPKLSQGKTHNLNRLISIKVIESTINNVKKKGKRKQKVHLGLLLNSTKHLRKKHIPILYNLFQRENTEIMFYNSFLTLVGQYYPKLKQTKRNQVNIDYISKCKCKIINHLKYNIGENLGDFEHGNFLNTASKV